MPSNTSNRETCRDELASLLTTALTGTGKPVQSVYNYRPLDVAGASPVVMVLSAGTRQRTKRGIGNTTRYHSIYLLNVLVFVMDANATDSWTRNNVEDQLDLIEKSIADVLADNRESSGKWNYIEHGEGGSQILPAVLGGKQYLMEPIPVLVEVIDV